MRTGIVLLLILGITGIAVTVGFLTGRGEPDRSVEIVSPRPPAGPPPTPEPPSPPQDAPAGRPFFEDFERPGPTPYKGWFHVVDRLHQKYNRAERRAWDDEKKITLKDGRAHVGTILRQTSDEVVIQTLTEVVNIKRSDIEKTEDDETFKPRSGRHAVHIVCWRGAGAFRSDEGWIGGGVEDPEGGRFPVGEAFTYRLKTYVKIVDGKRNEAFAALRWLDATGTPLGEDRSAPVRTAKDWTEVTLVVPRVDKRAAFVQITLSLEGPAVESGCLFDDVELVAQPRIRISPTDRSNFVYTAKEPVAAELSFADGLPEGSYMVVKVVDLHQKPIIDSIKIFSEGEASPKAPVSFGFDPPRPGYYEIEAEVLAFVDEKKITLKDGRAHVGTILSEDSDKVVLKTQTKDVTIKRADIEKTEDLGGDKTVSKESMPVVVIGGLGRPSGITLGDLGVTVNPYTTPYPDLPELIDKLGLQRVKIVLWDRGSPRGGGEPTLDSLHALVDGVWRLSSAPEVTGVLGRGPDFMFPALSASLAHSHPLNLFARSREEWQPQLKSILGRLNNVGRWQIAPDFVPVPPPTTGATEAFVAVSAAIKEEERTYTRVGMPIPLEASATLPSEPEFFSYTVDTLMPGITAPTRRGDLSFRLARRTADGGEAWERVTSQMIRSVVTARHRGLPVGAFLPLEDLKGRGLLTADGMPTPPLAALPVLNEVLAGAVAVSNLRLFNTPAREAIFMRGETAVIVAWTPSGTSNQIVYAGDEARLIDAFGRVSTPLKDKAITISTLPVYLVNVDGELLRTQSSVAFVPDEIDLQRRQKELELTFTNHFSLPMKSVVIGLEGAEEGWFIRPRTLKMIPEVKSNEPSEERKIRVRPPNWSLAGPGEIRIRMRFKVGPKEYSFTVNRLLKRKPIVEPIVTIEKPNDDGSVDVTVVVQNHDKTRSKTVQVTTQLPGQVPQKDSIEVKANQTSRALKFRIRNVGLVGEKAVVEVSVWEYGGTEAIATVREPVHSPED